MGLVYLDSSILITRIEGLLDYKELIENALKDLIISGKIFCISELVILEVLAKPLKNEDSQKLNIYQLLIDEMHLVKVPRDIFKRAMQIIKSEKYNAFDSLHIAVAIYNKCELFVTTDKHFKNCKSIRCQYVELDGTE